MDKKKLQWCLKQKNCVELIEPNKNLAEGYIRKAEDALEEMRNAKKKEWKIETGYYAMYHSVYSLFMKIGLKSEIHACTIEFAGRFLSEYFSEEDIEILGNALETRKNATYYVNREIKDEAFKEIMSEAPKILVKCKSILPKLTEKKISEIRLKIKAEKR